MAVSLREPGIAVSSFVHVALLGLTLVSFSQSVPFEEAQESVPVDMITENQLNEITRGEKTAKEILAKPTQIAQKIADVPDPKAKLAEVEAKTDVPTPPPSLTHQDDPGQDTTPVKPATPPPPTPAPKPTPAPPPPTPEPRPTQPDAEPAEPPKPQPRPKDPTPPKPEAKPDPLNKAELKKLLDKLPDPKTPPTPPSKPKSGEATPDAKPKMNVSEISKLLSKEPPGQKASTGRELSKVASLGSPTATGAKMSPSLWAGLDGLMLDQYKQCWSYLGLSTEHYIPQIKVEFREDGSLAGQPTLLNPPSDPNLRPLAESAMRAVRRCDPLKVPAQYAPYFNQWKSRILRFDPAELQG